MLIVTVKESEKALLYKNEKLVKVLESGRYVLPNFTAAYRYEVFSVEHFGIDIKKSELLYKKYPALIEKHFEVVALGEEERAYVWIDGKFTELLKAGATKLYFKEYDVRVERVNVKEEMQVDPKYVKLLEGSWEHILRVNVSVHEWTYLYVDNLLDKRLDVGVHLFYTDYFDVKSYTLDKRVNEMEITGQELLSADKVTLRCNVTMHYKISDGVRYLETALTPHDYLYKHMQFAIREHMGTKTVDEILEYKNSLSKEILDSFLERCEKIGVTIESVHIKDIILPGEMREIFNHVIEASKRAEANLIKRREETAATRSLLNTAKLMKDNPTLARLKELEALEKITQSVETLNVYGGLEGVMHNLVDLREK
ncbi:MAG: slipin family protein [Epsilonproteobacteria bacterium]|nr:slipin family protein [Campylobacterota bacterium]